MGEAATIAFRESVTTRVGNVQLGSWQQQCGLKSP